MNSYDYLVGALSNEKLRPEAEQEKLNKCAELGWELVTVLVKKYLGHDYTFYYLRRTKKCEKTASNPRFDMQLFKTS